MSDSQCSRKVEMSEEQGNNWVEVNSDFWNKSDYMKILESGVPLFYVGNSSYCDLSTCAHRCAKPEIYNHPSIVRLLNSCPVLHKKTVIYAVEKACEFGDIETVKALISRGLVDINDGIIGRGLTPLMQATVYNQTSIVSMLLTYNNLVLDKATTEG